MLTELVLKKVLGSRYAEEVELQSRKPEGRVFASEAVLPLLASTLYSLRGGPLIVAVPGEAAALADDIDRFIPGEAFHMAAAGPAGDWFKPYQESVGRRLKAARALRDGKVAVLGIEALLGCMPADLPDGWPLEIRAGAGLDLEDMLLRLVEGGYEREYTVEGWGKFAVRGGILDIFPSTAERPVRVEFEGDTVESLREFNVVTQRSSSRLDNLEVFPASDPGGGNAALPDALVVAVNPGLIEARIVEFCKDTGIEPPAGSAFDQWGTALSVDTIGGPGAGEVAGGAVFPGEPVREFRGDLEAAVSTWKKLSRAGTEVLVMLDAVGQVDRARELWQESGERVREPRMEVGSIRRGFNIPQLKVTLFSSSDLLGRKARPRAPRKVSSGTPVSSYAELEVGGHVVHEDQGIGVYRGLLPREALGVTREYLLIEYAGGDRLYVPTAQLSKVQRYIGAENPTVHKLRGKEWARSRKAARRSAERTARDLLQLYFERKSRPGHAFSPDGLWQMELESSFPYEETPDQARAVAEVKADMESAAVMDRLVCGDVGYGKTEVAVRAAMKAVLDSKQVAILVPTTVLAKQHHETFSERMAPFPLKVKVLSRFLRKAEQAKVADDIRRGEADVIIGTHRILQDDIAFKDLGLLVVDEEQRFGVEQKEKLRRLRRNVDTLTLTATPIPRTLQMSVSGVRDVSIIDTPPEDRHPVATYVGEFDMELVRSAVGYEVARDGQVFYVHNRIQSIGRVAEKLRVEFPGVSIAVAHGRMDEDELESVMLEFADGKHGVLVCTTIIESGLDLPNVNTLIVDRADRLGLAQLYQIRGRVGRAGKRAYAYLFYPGREVLTETAVARLSTISEMTPLGSGMRVALRDLEIRGAGNLLGAEQSGQIEAVGFEMYCELLKEAVEILKGESPPPEREAVVELPVDAYLPEYYITDQETRVEEYRRLIVAGRTGSIAEFASELEDRFGEPPRPVRQLLEMERLRLRAARAGLESVTARGNEMQLKAYKNEEGALAGAAARAGRFCEDKGIYADAESRTLYLKLRFEEVNNRQELLLKWLNSIIDDILESGQSA
ncbi:MAG TPA: transcription-repair coupling factor [Candidatus Anoxymicrobiaceae bacterium]